MSRAGSNNKGWKARFFIVYSSRDWGKAEFAQQIRELLSANIVRGVETCFEETTPSLMSRGMVDFSYVVVVCFWPSSVVFLL